jgi:hypothetical protein
MSAKCSYAPQGLTATATHSTADKPEPVAETILTGMPLVMSSADVAGLLGVSEQVVRHLCRTGQIPARHIGRRWFVSRERLAAVLDGDGGGNEE